MKYNNSNLVNAKELDEHLQAEAEKYGFTNHLEKLIYMNTHMSGWYSKYSGKSPLDKEFLDEYFKDKEQYLTKVRNLGAILYYIDYKYGDMV